VFSRHNQLLFQPIPVAWDGQAIKPAPLDGDRSPIMLRIDR
jgi:hypothetical protein